MSNAQPALPSPDESRATHARVETRSDHLRLQLAGEGALLFHYFWLRHNAPEDVHEKTRERILDARSIPIEIRPQSVVILGSQLVIDWGVARSRFELSWLAKHAYAREEKVLVPPSGDVNKIELHAADFTSLDALFAAAYKRTTEEGAVVVRGAGDDTESLIAAFERGGLVVRGTHFGRIEDLRTDNTTNQNTDQLGYTDAAIDLHTDQPFLDEPPRYQMLHGLRAADEGGESILVDARAAANYLREVDAEAFRIITTTPVTFHRKQRAFERIVTSPLLTVDATGAFLRVRHSYFTFAPFALSFDQMEPFYRAYQRFSRVIHERAHQWRFLLGPGDFVLYDNHRTLHARTGFRGPRWVRGIYFDERA